MRTIDIGQPDSGDNNNGREAFHCPKTKTTLGKGPRSTRFPRTQRVSSFLRASVFALVSAGAVGDCSEAEKPPFADEMDMNSYDSDGAKFLFCSMERRLGEKPDEIYSGEAFPICDLERMFESGESVQAMHYATDRLPKAEKVNPGNFKALEAKISVLPDYFLKNVNVSVDEYGQPTGESIRELTAFLTRLLAVDPNEISVRPLYNNYRRFDSRWNLMGVDSMKLTFVPRAADGLKFIYKGKPVLAFLRMSHREYALQLDTNTDVPHREICFFKAHDGDSAEPKSGRMEVLSPDKIVHRAFGNSKELFSIRQMPIACGGVEISDIIYIERNNDGSIVDAKKNTAQYIMK